MKRSKLFLGVTTCLLGIAAFAATKSKWTPTLATSYKTLNGVCLPDQQVGTIIFGGSETRLQTAIKIGPTFKAYSLYTNVLDKLNCVNPAFSHIDN
jgi:hypothetical protein